MDVRGRRRPSRLHSTLLFRRKRRAIERGALRCCILKEVTFSRAKQRLALESHTLIISCVRAATGNLTLPSGAIVETRQEYLYLCEGDGRAFRCWTHCKMFDTPHTRLSFTRAGWRADLRFLTGPEGGPAEDLRHRGAQDEEMPSSEMGYHFVTMDFEDRSGQGTGTKQKQAAGSAMQHTCGPDSYTGTAELLSDTAFIQVARSTQRRLSHAALQAECLACRCRHEARSVLGLLIRRGA